MNRDWIESKNLVFSFLVPSGGPEFPGGKEKLLGEPIIPPEGCTKPCRVYLNGRMLETTLYANYSIGGVLKTTYEAKFFRGGMLETTLDDNYSTGVLLETTLYANHSTGGMRKTT